MPLPHVRPITTSGPFTGKHHGAFSSAERARLGYHGLFKRAPGPRNAMLYLTRIEIIPQKLLDTSE
jgi:hypothetical protein